MWLLCLDPQCQPPLPESRFQLLAGAGFMLAADGLALLVQQNAVAAPQSAQWADQVQALGCTFQTLAALLQLQLDSTWQALLQLVKALLQQAQQPRSEEHTSELQSRPHLVCRLLLEKKKKKQITPTKSLLHCSASP